MGGGGGLHVGGRREKILRIWGYLKDGGHLEFLDVYWRLIPTCLFKK